MLSAKFSIPYAVATAIVQGVTDVSAFQPERVADPQIQALAQKVTIEADARMDLRRYDYPTAKVTVSLEDGPQFTRGGGGPPGGFPQSCAPS